MFVGGPWARFRVATLPLTGAAGTGCRAGVRGWYHRGPVSYRRRLCSPTLSGTPFGVLALLGGVFRGCRCARSPASFCDPSGVGRAGIERVWALGLCVD
jgi:hypothetical protein